MEYRLLGGSGFKVPVLSLGTGTFGGSNAFFKSWGDTGVPEATRLVDICLEAGVNLIDTADVYSAGVSEEIVGRWLGKRSGAARDDVVLATKGRFPTGGGPNDVGTSRRHLRRALEASLTRLGVDHIDLYQLHAWDPVTPLEETLSFLEDAVQLARL